MKRFKNKDFNKRFMIFLNLILLVIFVDIFSIIKQDKLRGFKKVISIFLISLFLGYAITLKWNMTILFAIFLTITVILLDMGRNKNENQMWELFQEKSDFLKPAGDMVEEKGDVGIAETDDKDETTFSDEDLDKILEKDESNNTKLPGLKDLEDLLESAKKESPYSENNKMKKTKDYTPAEAQRATYHLIDTVKQLKETMTSMMPLMQVGNNLIKLHKNIGGSDLNKALKDAS